MEGATKKTISNIYVLDVIGVIKSWGRRTKKMIKQTTTRKAKIFTDGATVGQNGKLGTVKEVGLGVLISEIETTFYSEKIKGKSNNEAEFKALIRAMEICIEKGIKIAEFNLDSQVVVNRANGRRPKKKKFKNERMDEFQNKIIELAKSFDKVTFNWVCREKNQVADTLSKKACELQ